MRRIALCPLLGALLLGLSSALVRGEGALAPSRYGIELSGYSRAQSCQPCHKDTYQAWVNSMHGNSLEDPVFLAAFQEAVQRYGEENRKYCLSCHSPTTRVTRDWTLSLPLSREGVTCDFCHTIVAVDLGRSEVFSFSPGATKIGPRSTSPSTAHLTARGLHLTKSEFCGGCHEMKGKNGVPLMETYSEWLASPYAAKNVHCQDCHMGRVPGTRVVNPEVRDVNLLAPDHGVTGAHSKIRLQNVARLESKVERKGRALLVRAWVTNANSGHMLPSGMPTRKVILTVSLVNAEGKVLLSRQESFEKVVVDENGARLDNICDSLLRAIKVAKDNRIPPTETRSSIFTLRLPRAQDFAFRLSLASTPLTVKLLLNYKFEAPRGQMDVVMASDDKVVFMPPNWVALCFYCAALLVGSAILFGYGMRLATGWLHNRFGEAAVSSKQGEGNASPGNGL